MKKTVFLGVLLPALLLSCTYQDEILEEKGVKLDLTSYRTGSPPQFNNGTFSDSTIYPWSEFTDLGYPSTLFAYGNGKVVHTENGKSTVLIQSNFPPGYYRIGINLKGSTGTTITMYQKQGKRKLNMLDQNVLSSNQPILLSFEFFVTDANNTIGFQVEGIGEIYDVYVSFYQPL